jgi:glycosyltransferase involved in cell wall biosynthesis
MRREVRRIMRQHPIDLMVYGPNHKIVGLPPFDVRVPRVFDYLDLCVRRDLSPDPAVERDYVRNSDLVLCTSPVLMDRVRALGGRPLYLPNGVDLGRASGGRRDATRRALGLEDRAVVSLIGPTWSDTAFFIDAIAAAARSVPNIALLVVGGGKQRRVAGLIKRCAELGVRLVVVDRVPHERVADYFAASDVGLYACDQTPFFDAACPLKVLEFSAAGKPIVATDLATLRRLGFPNVLLAAPDPTAFGGAIARACLERRDMPDLSQFDWTTLTDRFVTACEEMLSRTRPARVTAGQAAPAAASAAAEAFE